MQNAEHYFRAAELQVLLEWCQIVCSVYGTKVVNFTTSFADGKAFCPLIHHYQRGMLPLSDIRETRADFAASSKKGDVEYN